MINLLLFGWKLFSFIFLGARRQGVASDLALAQVTATPRRGNYANGLVWMTFLALLSIGIPLANTDPEFRTVTGKDVQMLLHMVTDAVSSAAKSALS